VSELVQPGGAGEPCEPRTDDDDVCHDAGQTLT
jgi:hypothetical protein